MNPGFNGNPLDPEQTGSFEELLMSQVVQQEVLTRLLVEKGICTKDEFWETVKMVNREMKKKKGSERVVDRIKAHW